VPEGGAFSQRISLRSGLWWGRAVPCRGHAALNECGASVDGRPSIFTALQEQLGLKLEARETTAGILVVDRADRIPTGN